MIAFGPVPSRRLGQSLGINHIPPKLCTYSCVYCQVGRTTKMSMQRAEFYPLERTVEEVGSSIEKVLEGGNSVDYISFVPDGESTLDLNLGQEIEMIGRFGIKTAVITNASLLWREDVREALLGADWVSVKVDSVREAIWRKINRPHGRLNLESILQGIVEFSKAYSGELNTETMLVKDLNDSAEHIEEVAGYISSLRPAKAYLSIPTRPPAEEDIRPPGEVIVNRSYQIFREYLDQAEFLIGYEGNAFSHTGDFEEDILSITAVHPMREDAVRDFQMRSNADWGTLEKLVAEGKLIKTEYRDNIYYLRRFANK